MKKIFVLIVCLTLLQGKIMATEGDPVEPIPLGVSLIDVDNAPINVGKGKAPIRIPRIYKDGYRLILGFHPEYIINIIQNGEVLYTSIIPEEQTDFELPSYINGECVVQFISGRFCFIGCISL
ncbi:hypothetical protein SAMN05216354_0111 [Xylanibacter ruminicola]|uniref:PEGA domain-containing protein n=1 Tax=Xylanibacter ruminicola TaxID=839 RepID=A0A1H5XSX2_XYLRU|nr:hypothetical protein [Xylanibacter ruminicola]SEG14753.1 hypothetical protein SAMN05216354_0111 [Xylanibacter ruminicola]